MSDDLKPCPFCGSTNVAQGASRDHISVWCSCGAQGPDVPFPEHCDPVPPIQKCHDLWNRRAAPAPTVSGETLPLDRETLGRMVREAWVRWAKTQPNPKPSWLEPYDALSEPDKEADRQIGESLAKVGYASATRAFIVHPAPTRAGVLEEPDMLEAGRKYEDNRKPDLIIRDEPFYSGAQLRAAYRHGYDFARALAGEKP